MYKLYPSNNFNFQAQNLFYDSNQIAENQKNEEDLDIIEINDPDLISQIESNIKKKGAVNLKKFVNDDSVLQLIEKQFAYEEEYDEMINEKKKEIKFTSETFEKKNEKKIDEKDSFYTETRLLNNVKLFLTHFGFLNLNNNNNVK